MRDLTDIALPDRLAVLNAVEEAMRGCATRWAWQGSAGAAARWARAAGPKDLDVWYDTANGDCPVDALREAVPCATIADARHPGRLRHVSLAVETPDGPAVVDLSFGDLWVGPILLLPVAEIDIDENHFVGAAAVADLLARPVLRGRWPDGPRLDEARAAWAHTAAVERRRLVNRLAAQLGRGVASQVVATLDGAPPDSTAPRRARLRLAARSLAPENLGATWAQRHSVVPAGRAAGPLGLRAHGVVVALVGTDGAGKSTVADGLTQRLHRYGFGTSSVYFGMARGNLPGVNLARRLLGVGRTAETRTSAGPIFGAVDAEPSPRAAGDAPSGLPPKDSPAVNTDRPWIRRGAAWFYAAEYAWRYLRTVAPQRARRRVVIADRWVYDLRESPWPGSRAARFAEWLIPPPDVLVLPDAPMELIHARKPERPYAEQSAQQQRYRRLLAQRPARRAEVVVDTSGTQPDPLRQLVASVVEAAHRAGGNRQR